MTITPLPPINENPLITTAHQIRQQYTDEIAVARARTDLADLQKAEAIIDFWRRCRDALRKAEAELRQEYRDQHDAINELFPFGPDNSASNPADRTVMQEAFHRQLDVAREAQTLAANDPSRRQSLLNDAVAFDDDTLLRAILTAASQARDDKFLRGWASGRPEFEGLLPELLRVREFLIGLSAEALIAHQVFAPLEEPTREVEDLPRLERARDAAEAEMAAQRRGRPQVVDPNLPTFGVAGGVR
ncbi:MAG: hypothetical protein PGN07_06285 [Aeromicrobium erythreum]